MMTDGSFHQHGTLVVIICLVFQMAEVYLLFRMAVFERTIRFVHEEAWGERCRKSGEIPDFRQIPQFS